jgi:hypothetical protein
MGFGSCTGNLSEKKAESKPARESETRLTSGDWRQQVEKKLLRHAGTEARDM